MDCPGLRVLIPQISNIHFLSRSPETPNFCSQQLQCDITKGFIWATSDVKTSQSTHTQHCLAGPSHGTSSLRLHRCTRSYTQHVHTHKPHTQHTHTYNHTPHIHTSYHTCSHTSHTSHNQTSHATHTIMPHITQAHTNISHITHSHTIPHTVPHGMYYTHSHIAQPYITHHSHATHTHIYTLTTTQHTLTHLHILHTHSYTHSHTHTHTTVIHLFSLSPRGSQVLAQQMAEPSYGAAVRNWEEPSK